MAFQVSSRIDSRTILDQMGAEQLLGHGDMLYMEAGMGVPTRIHGAFVADDEVHHVVDYLKEKSSPVYIESITKSEDIDSPLANIDGVDFGDRKSEGGGDVDELFDEAVDIVARTRRASISSVQRRLKIGYNRAATILEQMEAQGMVSAMQANGTREVLLPPRGDGEDE
jgi:S-DNA-T family DNA segregation ATPase FtsK/SpoIIIE